MRKFLGLGAAEGIAIGKVLVLNSASLRFRQVELSAEEEIEKEILAIEGAIEKVDAELSETETLADDENSSLSSIIHVHRALLQDKRLAPEAKRIVREEKVNAEWAFSKLENSLSDQFTKIKDPYIRNRFTDIRQIIDKLILVLRGEPELNLPAAGEKVVLVCETLSPSDTFSLNQDKIAGIMMEMGGPNSHTSIICREFGIPLVVGAEGVAKEVEDGEACILDGGTGEFFLRPGEEILKSKQRELNEQTKTINLLEDFSDKVCALKNGQRVPLEVNLDFHGGLQKLSGQFVDGVGLVRTEFMFVNHKTSPGEEVQYRKLREFVSAAKIPVCIRTWDIGSDKATLFFPAKHKEENPALGLRAVRICLKEKKFFRKQIRAILRLSEEFDVKMLIPMITNLQELISVKKIVRDEIEKLGAHENRLKLGSMVETPASVVIIRELLELSDFISIGSNDLIQYITAVDRNNDYVSSMCSPYHPAVLKMLETVVVSANLAGKPVSICGEISADPVMQLFLLGVGQISFSMDLSMINRTKHFLSLHDLEDCKKIAFNLLSNRTLFDNEKYLAKLRKNLKIKLHPEPDENETQSDSKP